MLFVGTILEENKQAHALVSRKNEVLQELVALQGQVESMNRHDMKNPLSVAINGPSVVLNTEPALSEGSRKLLEMARRSGYRVLDMINRSLDLYKLETGTYVLKPEKIDLREVLREVISQEKLSCEGQGNRQNFSLDTSMFKEDQGLWAYGEALLCHSIFSNLLRNAVDASPPGAPIAIQVGFCEASQMYKIGITNDGSVPADIQDSFFEKLVTRNKEKGTGFGTYSARLCVEVQGGKIALESAPDNKTRVVVWLPTWKED